MSDQMMNKTVFTEGTEGTETYARPAHVKTMQWSQALGLARKACAEIFMHGGKPEDALLAYKLSHSLSHPAHWGHAIRLIACAICDRRMSLTTRLVGKSTETGMASAA